MLGEGRERERERERETTEKYFFLNKTLNIFCTGLCKL
jgi:hypothetical protein